jgi:hypothetical protein
VRIVIAEADVDPEFKVEVYDAVGHVTTVDFSVESAPPPYAPQVTQWAGDVTIYLAGNGALPPGNLPAVPAELKQDAPCSDGDQVDLGCVRLLTKWAADLQDWLATSPNRTVVASIPDLPISETADADGSEVSQAVAGAVTLAARVAANPSDKQPVAVVFSQPVGAAELTSEFGANAADTGQSVSFSGVPSVGDLVLDRVAPVGLGVEGAVADYYTSADVEASAAVADVRAILRDDPADEDGQLTESELLGYLDVVDGQQPLIASANFVANSSYARVALRRAAQSSTAVIVVAPRPLDGVSVSFPDMPVFYSTSSTSRSAAGAVRAAGPSQPTCWERGEGNSIYTRSIFNDPNPAYFAPSRHLATTLDRSSLRMVSIRATVSGSDGWQTKVSPGSVEMTGKPSAESRWKLEYQTR